MAATKPAATDTKSLLENMGRDAVPVGQQRGGD